MGRKPDRPKPPPPRYDIEKVIDGHAYKGYYTVDGRFISVTLTGGGTRKAMISARGSNDTLARFILAELIHELRRGKA